MQWENKFLETCIAWDQPLPGVSGSYGALRMQRRPWFLKEKPVCSLLRKEKGCQPLKPSALDNITKIYIYPKIKGAESPLKS